METLSSYTHDKQSALFAETGAFFAFSGEQLKKNIKDGVKYVSLGSGMIVPKANVDRLLSGLEAITNDGIATDIRENGMVKIIRRELANYECFYTGDVSDCVDALSEYPVTRDEIFAVFNHAKATEDLSEYY